MKYYLYNIVTATEQTKGECHIGFPSLTFQNPEEGANKLPKRRFFNKNDSYNYLSFLNFGLPHQNSLDLLINQSVSKI